MEAENSTHPSKTQEGAWEQAQAPRQPCRESCPNTLREKERKKKCRLGKYALHDMAYVELHKRQIIGTINHSLIVTLNARLCLQFPPHARGGDVHGQGSLESRETSATTIRLAWNLGGNVADDGVADTEQRLPLFLFSQ